MNDQINHPTNEAVAEVDVVVIGAGLAGLVTAMELVRSGLRVRCFEARDRVGGRTLSAPTGLGPVDLGATWFWPSQDDVVALARRVGSPTFAQHLAGDVLLEQPTPGGAQVQRVAGNPIDVPSYRFAHGAQDLARRLAASLPDGVLALDTPVTSVARMDEGVLVRTTSTNPALAEVKAPCVVVAVSPALAVATIDFGSTLDSQVADVAARTAVWMGEVVKAVAVYVTPFWREQGLAGAAISYAGPFRELHDLSGPNAVPAALFGFAPAELFAGVARDAMAAAFVDQLARLFGAQAATPAVVRVKNWANERWTNPPAAPTAPARTTATFGHPAFGTANPSDRLLWASTETSEHHPGHLAGAIQAGTRAARTAIAAHHAAPGATGA